MTNVHKPFSDTQLVNVIIHGIEEVKGRKIVVLDLRSIPHAVSDFFIVCHGESHTQVQGIARSVEEEVSKKLDDKPSHKEGTQNANWVLLDYLDVVVHIFHREDREYYALEDLWADAEVSAVE